MSAETYSERRFMMNTVIELQLYEPVVKETIEKIFAVFKRIDWLCNRFDSHSQVYQINAMAGKHGVAVSADVLKILRLSKCLSDFMQGAFDITIGAVTDLWGIGHNGKFVPSKQALKKILPLINYKMMEMGTQSVFLPYSGMKIDLGGIAKEYALHLAAEVAFQNGVTRGLISAGGDLCTIGEKPNDETWCIGIQHPRRKNTIIGKVFLHNWNTVETSGDYRRYIKVNGNYYTHVFDPTKGMSTTDLTSVSLIYRRNGTAIPITGSGIMVLGLEKSLQLLRTIPQVEAIFIMKNQEIIITSGLKKYVVFPLIEESNTILKFI